MENIEDREEKNESDKLFSIFERRNLGETDELAE